MTYLPVPGSHITPRRYLSGWVFPSRYRSGLVYSGSSEQRGLYGHTLLEIQGL